MKQVTEEMRKRMSQSHLGKFPSAETRAKLSLARMGNKNNFGHKASEETREKMRLAHSGEKNHFFHKCHTEEAKEKIRLSRIGKPTTLGACLSDETKNRISKAKLGKPVNKSLTRSQTYISKWQDPDFAKGRISSILRSAKNRPNKSEKQLMNLLETNFPGEYKYVGDGSFVIGRLNPDFVNINGRKQVIELFGNYWHKPEEALQRENTFSEYGFQTLIIWESELSDFNNVIAKLINFRQLSHSAGQSRASKSNNICSGQV